MSIGRSVVARALSDTTATGPLSGAVIEPPGESHGKGMSSVDAIQEPQTLNRQDAKAPRSSLPSWRLGALAVPALLSFRPARQELLEIAAIDRTHLLGGEAEFLELLRG